MTQGNQASRVLTCTALVLLVIALCIVWGNMGKPHNHDQPSHPTAATPVRTERPARTYPKPSVPHPPAAQADNSSSTSSETTVAFHASRAKLMRSHQQLMRGLANATPEEQHQAMEQWHKENAEALAAQQQLAIQMGAESRPLRMHVPKEPIIPDGAEPELRHLLTARHAIMKGQAEINNQLHDATPEERHQAMGKWHQENAPLVEAMHTAAIRHSASQHPPASLDQ
ncbi:MAG: hypothetical protein ACRCXD_03135 [Luteolibacter sp.]